MSPVDAIQSVFRKYATFSGRAGRAEYWWFFLFNIVVAVVLYLVVPVVYYLFLLAVLIPSIAVGVRRLHDTGRSGWWYLVGLIPLVGWIIVLYFFALRGSDTANQYGPATGSAPA